MLGIQASILGQQYGNLCSQCCCMQSYHRMVFLEEISCLKIQEGKVSKCFPATEDQSQHFQGVTSPLLSKCFTKRQDAGAPWAFTAPWCQLRSNSDNCYASCSILLGSGKIQFSIKWGCHLNTIKATLKHRQKGLSLLWMPSTSPQ